MSGDSLPITLPLSRMAAGAWEVTAWYRELRKPLLRYLVCLGLSNDEAQDVVQDVFLRLHRHISSGGAQDNIRGWVFRVADNQARNRQGRYQRPFREPLDVHKQAPVDNSPPEGMLLQKERYRRVEQAIRLLTDTERQCHLL